MTDGPMESYIKGVAASSIQSTTGWTVDIPDQSGLMDMLNKLIQHESGGKKIFAPVKVSTDCPYASYVEFGTGPAQHPMVDPEGARKRQDSMEKWVVKRLGTEPNKAQAKAKELIRVINKRGIAPHPYFRSAIAAVMDHNDLSLAAMSKGYSIKDVGEDIIKEIKNNLDSEKFGEGDPLADSFVVEEYTNYTAQQDGKVAVSGLTTDQDPTVTKDMWDNKETGRYGKRPHHKRT